MSGVRADADRCRLSRSVVGVLHEPHLAPGQRTANPVGLVPEKETTIHDRPD
jgi:hypothetical protein